MERVIKFRVWDRMGLRMSDAKNISDLFCFDEDWNGARIFFPPSFYVPEMDCELMQFTGLTDSKEVAAFEGDIMKVLHRTVGRGDKTKQKYFFRPVEFYKGEFMLPFGDYGAYRFRDGGIEDAEVIGNIYEHPDLLSNPPIKQ